MDVPRKRPSGSEADGRLPMSAADEAEDATEQAELRELLSSATVLSPDALARVRELMINSTRRRTHAELQMLLAQGSLLSDDEMARVRELMTAAARLSRLSEQDEERTELSRLLASRAPLSRGESARARELMIKTRRRDSADRAADSAAVTAAEEHAELQSLLSSRDLGRAI